MVDGLLLVVHPLGIDPELPDELLVCRRQPPPFLQIGADFRVCRCVPCDGPELFLEGRIGDVQRFHVIKCFLRKDFLFVHLHVLVDGERTGDESKNTRRNDDADVFPRAFLLLDNELLPDEPGLFPCVIFCVRVLEVLVEECGRGEERLQESLVAVPARSFSFKGEQRSGAAEYQFRSGAKLHLCYFLPTPECAVRAAEIPGPPPVLLEIDLKVDLADCGIREPDLTFRIAADPKALHKFELHGLVGTLGSSEADFGKGAELGDGCRFGVHGEGMSDGP